MQLSQFVKSRSVRIGCPPCALCSVQHNVGEANYKIIFQGTDSGPAPAEHQPTPAAPAQPPSEEEAAGEAPGGGKEAGRGRRGADEALPGVLGQGDAQHPRPGHLHRQGPEGGHQLRDDAEQRGDPAPGGGGAAVDQPQAGAGHGAQDQLRALRSAAYTVVQCGH